MTCYRIPARLIDPNPFQPNNADQGQTDDLELEHQVQNHQVQNHQVQNHQAQNYQIQNHQDQRRQPQNHRPQNQRSQNHQPQNQHQGHWSGAIATTMTVTLASAAVFQALDTTPNYEGRVQLVGILPPSVSPSAPTSTPDPTVAILATELAPSNIAPPDLIEAAYPSLLRNPAMIAAVKMALAEQGTAISHQALTEQLSAQTSAQGWLELHYRDSNPDRVQQVLAEVAQWYAAQVPTCEIQACDEVAFIESQIPIVTQQQHEIKQTLGELQQTMQAKLTQTMLGQINLGQSNLGQSNLGQSNLGQSNLGAGDRPISPHPSNMVGYDPIDYSMRQLAAQHRDVTAYANKLDETITQTRDRLDRLQAGMDLATVKPQSGFALLHHVIPEYDDWLETWQKGDRHLLAAQLNIDAGFSPVNGDNALDTLRGNTLDTLAESQKAQLAQMNQAISALSQAKLSEMAAPIRALLIGGVIRIGYMDEWLSTLHHLQLLELRRQTITDFQGAIATQTQEWQQLYQTRRQLQRQLETTAQTLATYEQKHAIAQRQVNKHGLAWQVVTPPEIVHQPFLSGELFSRLSHLGQPLMTLRTP